MASALLTRNPTLVEVLGRAAALALPDWYLVAGCLYQTVWNVVTGQAPESGIIELAHLRPFGLGDVLNLVARPNPVLAPRHVYQAKTTRWRQQWPSLTVLPWPAHDGDTATS